MKMRVGLFVCVLACVVAVSAVAADWPWYRGPNHNGITSETDWSHEWPAEGPKTLWKASVGVGFSSMTVAGGRVYTMGNVDKKTDVVWCFDAETGKELWTHRYACPLEAKYYEGGTLSTPTVDGDRVYSLSKMGDLFCLNAADGKVVWQKQLNKELGFKHPTWHFASSGLISGDLIIFNMGDAGLALNKKTGQVEWENGKGECGYSTPVPAKMGGKDLVVLFGKDSTMAVQAVDGKPTWRFKWETKYDVNAADPIVIGDTVFVSSGYDRGCGLFRIEADKGVQVWENKVIRNHMNCSMLIDGYIYGFDEPELRCLDLKDGKEKWGEGSLGKGALMASADGRLIIMSEEKGELVIAKANPAGFTALAKARILPKGKCWTTPVLANGRIYARNAKGDMVCVSVKP